MISLRQHIDNYRSGAGRKPEPDLIPDPATIPASSDDGALAAFRSLLLAMGECGQRAVPSVGKELSGKLAEISQRLASAVTPDLLNKANEDVRAELSVWADAALQRHNENEREIREIMGVVARAAEAIGARDAKYSHEIANLTLGIRSIGNMRDLATIRMSISDSTNGLKSCVEKMVEDGKASMRHLEAEVEEYRSRLDESERAGALDPLTRLANRRAFEKHLKTRISQGNDFSLVLLDLNGFKTVNDQNGHLAGDDLLRQFATELRGQFTPLDMVCRWGGDEFAVIVEGGAKEAAERVERINRWVFGEYKIRNGTRTVKTFVSAGIGVVQWDGKETGLEMVARADAGLYRNKSASKHASQSVAV